MPFSGNNTLKINQATMIKALQLWVESEFKNPPKVLSVVQTPPTGHSSTEFDITIQEVKTNDNSGS